MIQEMSSGDVLAKLRPSPEPWVQSVIAALGELDPDTKIRLNVVPALDLHRIYSVRLTAQREGKGPNAENLEHFVEALDTSGSVELFTVEDTRGKWIALLRDGSPLSYVRIANG